MKYKTDKSLNVHEVGGLEKKKATISQDKMLKLFDLLQAPYSNPIGSIVRETATNGWDAHVEAGQHKPILIRFEVDENSGYSVEFIDYGVGMSPERMNKVYLNYLESTKEDTNDQSGYFGIGSKSPLSYTDEYLITTVVDKVEYQYMVRKEDDGVPTLITIDTSETDQGNGTSIKIFIDSREDCVRFLQEINDQLRYFEHIVVDNRTDIDTVPIQNDFKIVRSKRFVIRLDHGANDKYVIRKEPKLYSSIGQVAYPLDEPAIRNAIQLSDRDDKEVKRMLSQIDIIKSIGAALYLNIGEVNVTLTRESIKYSRQTYDYLIDRLDECFKDLIDKNMHSFDEIIVEDVIANSSSLSAIKSLLSGGRTYVQFIPEMDPIILTDSILASKQGFIYQNQKYSSYRFHSILEKIIEKVPFRVYDRYNNLLSKDDEKWPVAKEVYQKLRSGQSLSQDLVYIGNTLNEYTGIYHSEQYSKVNKKWISVIRNAGEHFGGYYSRRHQRACMAVFDVVPKSNDPLVVLVYRALKTCINKSIEDQVDGNRTKMIRNLLPSQAIFSSLDDIAFEYDETFDGMIEHYRDYVEEYMTSKEVKEGYKGPIRISLVKKAMKHTVVATYLGSSGYGGKNSPMPLYHMFGTEHGDSTIESVHLRHAPLFIRVDQKTMDELWEKHQIPTVEQINEGEVLIPKGMIKKYFMASWISSRYPAVAADMGLTSTKQIDRIGTSKDKKKITILSPYNEKLKGWNEAADYIENKVGTAKDSTFFDGRMRDIYDKAYPGMMAGHTCLKDLERRLIEHNIIYDDTDIHEQPFGVWLLMKYWKNNFSYEYVWECIAQTKGLIKSISETIKEEFDD